MVCGCSSIYSPQEGAADARRVQTLVGADYHHRWVKL